ncbi:MAG: hypothetical protein KJZ57_00015 [Anaerolineales bacterium]|nr:hypothetical protein [Anaerolineales bacterium]
MAAPLIEAGDITESGNNTASSSWAVSYPNASAGDLLIFNLGWDDSTTTSSVTAPAGPNGEVLSSIAGPVASNSTEVRGQSWFTIATGTWTASTLTFTPSASEQWTAGVIKVPAGEFDPRDPMGAASTRASADTADTTVDSVGYAIGAADGGGTLVWFAIVDTVALGSLSSGWTSRVTRDRGDVAIGIATRNAATTASETTSSTDTWGISADSWASIAYVVRPPPTLYYVVYPSAASEPSAAQVKAGQQQSGAAATAAGSETARTTTGEEVFAAAATGLTGGTSYKTSFVWSDGANDSAVHTTAAWTTAAIYNEDTTDSGALTDASAAMMLLVGSASDSGVLTDTASGQRVSGDAISDSGALTDTAAGGLALAASASDSAASSESVSDSLGSVTYNESAEDTAAASETVASLAVLGDAVSDSAAGSETVAISSAPPVTTAYPGPAGKSRGKRRRVLIGDRLYNVFERDIPALLEAELLDRAPPVTAEVIEGPKPPRKRAKKAPQPVKTVEQVRETVQQIKRRIEPDDAWLAQALEAVAFRVLERLQDEEDSLMLLLAA